MTRRPAKRLLAILLLQGLAPPAWPEVTGQPDDASPAAVYCLNIADKAADARLARQMARLKEMEKQVEVRVVALEERRVQVQQWVERQEALLKAAESSLVEIYARMDPEAAAGQLASLDLRLSASILHQLKPREASAILNVMKTERAAELVRLLASVTRHTARDGAQ